MDQPAQRRDELRLGNGILWEPLRRRRRAEHRLGGGGPGLAAGPRRRQQAGDLVEKLLTGRKILFVLRLMDDGSPLGPHTRATLEFNQEIKRPNNGGKNGQGRNEPYMQHRSYGQNNTARRCRNQGVCPVKKLPKFIGLPERLCFPGDTFPLPSWRKGT